MTVGGLATGVNATIGTIRRRRLDGSGLLVVLEVALSIGLLVVTNDARILLIRPSFFVALGAIYAFITCLVGRPIVYDAAKPLATRGDPARLAAYELAWERSPSVFARKMYRQMLGVDDDRPILLSSAKTREGEAVEMVYNLEVGIIERFSDYPLPI